MALELIIDSLETVDEAVRGLYIEKDGKFSLDVSGLPDNTGLKSALDAERKASKDAKAANAATTARFEGIDPDKTREMLKRFENDEEAKLIADGKIDEVVNMRSEKLRVDMQKQVDEANTGKDAAFERSKKYEQKVLDSHILSAASKIGIHKHAIDDALFRGRNMFSLDDGGNPVQLGADGKPVFGKDGKTLFTPDEWLSGSKEWAPHWHPAGSSGSGGDGGDGGGADSRKTITRDAFMGLSPEAQKKAVMVDKLKIIDT